LQTETHRNDTHGHGRVNVRSSFVLVLTAFIWGMAFVAQRVGMDFIGPFLFVGIRMCLGALTLVIVLLVRGMIRSGRGNAVAAGAQAGQKAGGAAVPQAALGQGGAGGAGGAARGMDMRRLIKAGLVCGIVVFVGSSLQQVGLVFTTASKAGFLTTLYIVIVPLYGIALRHKTHWNTWISVLIAVVGLYFLCISESFSIALGDLILLMGALFWAAHIMVIDHFVKGLNQRDVLRLCIAQFVVAAALSLLFSPFLDRLFVHGSFEMADFMAAVPSLLYVGILSTGLAFTLQAVGQQGVSPSAASIIMSLEAVFSVIGGMLILHEALTLQEGLGCLLMFAAVILSQLPVGAPKQVT